MQTRVLVNLNNCLEIRPFLALCIDFFFSPHKTFYRRLWVTQGMISKLWDSTSPVWLNRLWSLGRGYKLLLFILCGYEAPFSVCIKCFLNISLILTTPLLVGDNIITSGSENLCHSKNDILLFNLICFYGGSLKLSRISRETSK